jgi:hypothetical protein
MLAFTNWSTWCLNQKIIMIVTAIKTSNLTWHDTVHLKCHWIYSPEQNVIRKYLLYGVQLCDNNDSNSLIKWSAYTDSLFIGTPVKAWDWLCR